jgi:hypothetical protein
LSNNAFSSCSKLTQITVNRPEGSLSGAPWGAVNATVTWAPPTITKYENPKYWTFDSVAGIITRYVGPNVDTLVIPNYIDGVKVNSIVGLSAAPYGITYGKYIKNLTISNEIANIGNNAFRSCSSITSITIPSSVTSIGASAFSSCTNLTSVTIPSSITSIGNSAFSSCTNLTSITIPNSVTSLGTSEFSSCTKLTNAILSKNY